MRSRRVAAFVAVVFAFASYGAIAATFGLCHKSACCEAQGQQVSAPPKCCDESACEAAAPVAAAVERSTLNRDHAASAILNTIAAGSAHSITYQSTSRPAVAPDRLASICVLRI
jgi:hypothetical protein